MKLKKKPFLAAANELPDLYYDFVLLESRYPVLFSCTDDNDTPYIVSCYAVSGAAEKWLIAETTNEKLVDLLSDKKTIQAIFVDPVGQHFMVEQIDGAVKAKRVAAPEIPEEILPTAGYYMDADTDEFAEEIRILEGRAAQQTCNITEYRLDSNLYFLRREVKSFYTFPAYVTSNDTAISETIYSHECQMAWG
ncbi:MAG: hypothetical protein RR211_00240 [Pseudoflavonifractor sp.]